MSRDWRKALSDLPGGAAVDTHVHTNYSDGTHEPAEVVRRALAAGLAGIAISDHDTIEGYLDAERLLIPPSFLLLPSVELTAYHDGLEVHILGYGVDPSSPVLKDYLDRFALQRKERARKIVSNLYRAGVKVSWKRIESGHGPGVLGRMHIARELVNSGYCRTLGQAFSRYLCNSSRFVEPKFSISVGEAAELVHTAGGKAVLAHPGALSPRLQVTVLMRQGLDGLEARYPFHHPMQEKSFLEYARKRGIPVLGGSDYHGANRPSVKLGDRFSTADELRRLLEV